MEHLKLSRRKESKAHFRILESLMATSQAGYVNWRKIFLVLDISVIVSNGIVVITNKFRLLYSTIMYYDHQC